jgi:hypothetical protein
MTLRDRVKKHLQFNLYPGGKEKDRLTLRVALWAIRECRRKNWHAEKEFGGCWLCAGEEAANLRLDRFVDDVRFGITR